MIQFQENARADGRAEGPTEEPADPILFQKAKRLLSDKVKSSEKIT